MASDDDRPRIMRIPEEDQAAWAFLLGEDPEPVNYVCDQCHLPAVRTLHGWQHASAADAVFCGLIFGTASPGQDDSQ